MTTLQRNLKFDGIKTFENEEFGELRTVTMNNEPWFVGKDIAEALGYKDTVNAIKQHVDETDKRIFKGGKTPCLNISNRGVTIINESGMYALIFGSKLDSAKEFKHWVTSEVLPSIRKNGGYIANQENMSDVEIMAHGLMAAENIIKAKNKQIEGLEFRTATLEQKVGELKPSADYTDRILKNNSLVTISQIAKDYGMSGRAMNKTLHELGIQYKQSGQWLLYSKYHDKGYTHSKTIEYEDKEGNMQVKMNTKWTQKGRLFLYDELKKVDIMPTIEQD